MAQCKLKKKSGSAPFYSHSMETKITSIVNKFTILDKKTPANLKKNCPARYHVYNNQNISHFSHNLPVLEHKTSSP